jgi:hypothetical protein
MTSKQESTTEVSSTATSSREEIEMGRHGVIDPTEHTEHRDRASRPTNRDRIRPGRSLLLFPAIAATAWALLIGAFAAVSQMFGPEDDRGTWGDVSGAALGNFVMAFVVAFVVSVVVRTSTHPGTTTTEKPVDWDPPTSPAEEQQAKATQLQRPRSPEPRRVARGAAIGALPGFLVAVVPVVLHEFGVISSDQSQIGFIGLPMLVIGTLVGIATAASGSGSGSTAVVGGLVGFVVGFVAGLLVAAAVQGLALAWLVLAPLGMISGATVATHLRLRHLDEHLHG